VKRAYATGQTGQVTLEWEKATDQNGISTYKIYAGTDINKLDLVGGATSSDTSWTSGFFTDQQLYYFLVRAVDDAGPNPEDKNEDKNNVILSATPTSGVDRVNITAVGDDVSEVGKPIMIKLEARNTGNTATITDFNDKVKVSIHESSNRVLNSWIVSTQDRTEDRGVVEVELVDGVGYFTVDTIEPERITLYTTGYGSDQTLDLRFTSPNVGGTAAQLVLHGPSQTLLGDSIDDGALVWISAVDSSGAIVTTYTGSITVNLSGGTYMSWEIEQGENSGSGSSSGDTYTFHPDDKGQIAIRVKSTNGGGKTISLTSGLSSNTINVTYTNSAFSLSLFAGNVTDLAETIGTRIKMTAYARNGATLLDGFTKSV
jgi:hypothetical protein